MKVTLLSCPAWSSQSPNLALATLQARLKQKGHVTQVYDLSPDFYQKHKNWYIVSRMIQNWSSIFPRLLFPFYHFSLYPKRYYDKISKDIVNSATDVVCFSVYSSNMITSLYSAKKIKEKNKKIKMIFGGPACHTKRIRDTISKYADYIVASEGDLVLPKILNKIVHGTQKIKPEIVKHLENEPLPDFTGFGMENNRPEYLPYATTRGCYNNCTFCFDKLFWQKFRFKSAKKVFADLKKLNKIYGINKFSFADSTLLGNQKNIELFCNLVIENKFKIRWGGQISSTSMNAGLIRKMKKAGCGWLSFGVESGSQRVVNLMKKGHNLPEIQDQIRNAKKNRIRILTCFMVGYPTETWSDFYKTVQFLNRNRQYIFRAFVSITKILEGTTLHKSSEESGIRNKNSLFWYSKNNNIIIRLTRLVLIKIFIITFVNKKLRY